MLLDVESFRRRTRYDLDGLVADLAAETHRSTAEERTAWRNSLPTVADVLGHDSLRGFHLHLGARGGLVVEYRLPATAHWADLVLLGRGANGPSAVVVELKDWNIDGDSAGPHENLVRRHARPILHPSDQVRGYVEYCRRFHSAVQEWNASVSGCVCFTYASSIGPYQDEPHARLTAEYPVFARSEEDLERRFPTFLTERLVAPDVDFAQRFETGVYKQDRSFVRQISAAIRRSPISPFVLLDKQREGFELCMHCIKRRLGPARPAARTATGKSVVVVKGPPGSGKSVIAAHIWASLVDNERVAGNVVLTTTSTSQRSNWEAMFSEVISSRAARGVVVGANRYNPGLSQQWLKRRRDAGHEASIQSWRENLEALQRAGAQSRCPDDSFAVSVVDEAHALIDPTIEDRRGMSASGWMLHAGPQAWHVIRASKVAVFLLDPAQSYRDNETTTIERIKEFALEFGADYTEVSLDGSQFRCGGSAEYLTWLDESLQVDGASRSKGGASPSWRRSRTTRYELETFEGPDVLESALRERLLEGHTARIVASYARKWRTKRVADPHALDPANKDFNIEYVRDGERKTWTRIWNYAPKANYSLFVQAPPGSPTSRDPLCEVGCPYVVRGYDFQYVGLLWFSDLVWRGDRWRVNLEHVHESAWRLVLAAARRGVRGAEEEVIRRLQRGYRILLSRAIRGTYVWFEDEETRAHMQRVLSDA
jgi:hypothetical protein